MKIKIVTEVSSPLQSVWERFDERLFLALNPPFPPVKLLRFDGSMKGDLVGLELNFFLFRQKWTSEITDQHQTPNEITFVDEGTTLPFFFSSWKHTHQLKANGTFGTYIIDDIEYSTGNIITDWLMKPALYAQFLYRKPIYRKYFAR